MKISLNMNQRYGFQDAAGQDKDLERMILAVRAGDWDAKERLSKIFLPLIQDLASKRTTTGGKDVSLLVEAGRRGVIKATKKYRPNQGPHAFRVAVVEHIERAIDRAAKGSFLSKLFGG